MGILNIYRNEYKKTVLPDLRWTDKQIRKEMELIAQKKSTLSARQRKAVMKMAVDFGIAKIV
ncbi:MAG: hypothetical protein CVV49_08890 [Spirochaetae bacterium HGW-Spirochaetae-5]|nr:MAG: hypothetical protein CVV49_08890 [Spirochaetae bacterium HGW-Spirochaetae-5]